MDVSRAILSVAALRDDGWGVNFPEEKDEVATIERAGAMYALREHGRLFYLPVHLVEDPKEVDSVHAEDESEEKVKNNDRPWMLFEWCCEADSLLSS
eukprot:5152261-Heterocapsa_arctica.AAC.1